MAAILPHQLGQLTVRQLLCLCLEREPDRKTTTIADLIRDAEDEATTWRGS